MFLRRRFLKICIATRSHWPNGKSLPTLITLAFVGLLGVDATVAAAIVLNPGTLVDAAVERLVWAVGTVGLLVANLAVRDALLALEHATTLELTLGTGWIFAWKV